jgi:UPF0716 protein FxsA
MFVLLALLVVVPIAEIAVMVKVADWIGTGQMIALLLSISIVGAWIVKRQGTGTLRRIRAELDAGRVPGAHLVDGGLLLLAGLLLLLPTVRAFLRGRLGRRFRPRVISYSVGGRTRRPATQSNSPSNDARDYLELDPPSPN